MDIKTLSRLYYLIVKIRKFEEKIIEAYPQQEMRCPVHLSVGQEAIAAGIGINLKPSDCLFSNHRNHGHIIAKGANMKMMFAEIYGRKTGCSHGKGGSEHMIFLDKNIHGTSAIVGGGIPIAAGATLAIKLMKKNDIVVVFFGDGAADQGVLYETLNFASLKKLPILFVCENNFYATNSPQSNRQSNTNIHQIADFFSIPKACINGNNVFEVFNTAKSFIANTRKNSFPSLIEARTYRHRTHVGYETDIDKGLRSKEEVERWLKLCPYKTFKNEILKSKQLTESDLSKIEKSVDSEVNAAWKFALKSPWPTKKDLTKDVY